MTSGSTSFSDPTETNSGTHAEDDAQNSGASQYSDASESAVSGNVEEIAKSAELAPADSVSTTGSALSAVSEPAVFHGSASGEFPVTVTLTQPALLQLEDHCYSVLDAEIGGVLLGRVIRKGTSSTIKIQAVLPVKTDDYGPVHFTFSADSWALLHKERAVQYPNMDIVGWYHTHPGLGVFYSADDVVVHSAAFVMPWHVGLVIDPVYKEGSWFGWRSDGAMDQESGLQPIGGYYELLGDQKSSIVSWKLVEASIWDKSYTPEVSSSLSDQVYVAANDWPALPPISPWWGVLLGGVSLVLVILLLLDRLIAFAN